MSLRVPFAVCRDASPNLGPSSHRLGQKAVTPASPAVRNGHCTNHNLHRPLTRTTRLTGCDKEGVSPGRTAGWRISSSQVPLARSEAYCTARPSPAASNEREGACELLCWITARYATATTSDPLSFVLLCACLLPDSIDPQHQPYSYRYRAASVDRCIR